MGRPVESWLVALALSSRILLFGVVGTVTFTSFCITDRTVPICLRVQFSVSQFSISLVCLSQETVTDDTAMKAAFSDRTSAGIPTRRQRGGIKARPTDDDIGVRIAAAAAYFGLNDPERPPPEQRRPLW